MSDEAKTPVNLGPLILRPIEHALAAAEREALAIGVPTHSVVQMLMNHLASIVACVEPPGVRAELVKDIMGNLGALIRQHVEHRYIIQPKAPQPTVKPDPETEIEKQLSEAGFTRAL